MIFPRQQDLESGTPRPPPSLYQEAHDMLLNAFLMFCLPDLRAC